MFITSTIKVYSIFYFHIRIGSVVFEVINFLLFCSIQQGLRQVFNFTNTSD